MHPHPLVGSFRQSFSLPHREKKILMVLMHYATLFYIYYLLILIHTLQPSFIHPSRFAEACLLVSSSLLRSAREEPPWGAEPRIKLWPALQQPDALPTEPRRENLRRGKGGSHSRSVAVRWKLGGAEGSSMFKT
jgi:hypothetical protein